MIPPFFKDLPELELNPTEDQWVTISGACWGTTLPKVWLEYTTVSEKLYKIPLSTRIVPAGEGWIKGAPEKPITGSYVQSS